MTKKQMLDECKRLAPDFAMKLAKHKGADIIATTCTIDGKPHELSHAIGGWPRSKVELLVLETALRSLRARRAA